MKTKWIILFVFSFLFLSNGAQAESLKGKVKLINFYGGNWPNSWSGGMLFQLDTNVEGVTYFGIRASDKYQQQLLSILLAAKHAGSQVVISYAKASIDTNGYATVSAVTTL
jgi:hypothetical protein